MARKGLLATSYLVFSCRVAFFYAMSKRFIDTGFLDQKWIRKLSPERKIFLVYLMLKCDNGGIIDLDIEDVEFWIGKKIGDIDFLPNDYLIPLNDSGKYFMPKFIEWQYKDLTSQKFIVAQARQILEKQNLINSDFTLKLPNCYVNVIKEVPESQEQGKGKGIGNGVGIGKDKGKELENCFEIFRQNYPGTKRGFNIEIENLKKKHKDWYEIIPILSDALTYQKSAREIKHHAGGFVPEWKNLQTWINQRCWEEEIETNYISNGTNRKNSGATTDEIIRAVSKHFPVEGM